LLRGLGKQFRNLSLEICLDVANALRNACECPARMQKGIVIELDEGLKRDTQALAVIEKRAMVIGNPPWAGIDIEALLEFAGLPEATEFSEQYPPRRSVCSPWPAGELQNLDVVSSLAQLRAPSCRQAGAEDKNGRPSDRPEAVGPLYRVRREPQLVIA
jgi:hypothetical protein